MKKLLLLSLAIVFTFSVKAQTIDKKWGIGAGIGAYGTLNNGGIGLMPELYFGRYLSPRLDIVLKGDVGLYNSKIISKLDLVNPFLNLKFKLSNESAKLRSYVFAGPGYLYNNNTEAVNFDLGLGAKYYIGQNTALYMEAAYFRGLESTTYDGITDRENLWKATVGLKFDFGRTIDTDMDGVSDNKDKCPDTPTGVAVDANGCPVDTDGDGVADYIDECPTVAGLTSLKGCPDADGDGVADKNDKCPDTPKGWKVDASGCPLDQDKDGVADAIDKCTDTPDRIDVDKNGCPVDTDGDGVADYLDKCPTVAGTIENKGCPVIEATEVILSTPDMQVEPVYFGYDKANYMSGEKKKIDQLVKILKADDKLKVNLTGNADSKGTAEYNMTLTEKRIDSVVQTIQSGGIPENRISKEKALGETKPAATNETPEGRALNRRVTFEVIQTK
jgi:outer membrane protein OmpA-like peptidoglycan-associated protein